ncbi:hypothetical protein TorRG33x02_294950 [Trema orientale]|uniref:Uncharacterized protein n=1 Tax=Trema orientale TaxID=63057 RepID=A0A2P5C711_TREOI|nr:hypothetical protein TorRG33x02_294950 [Trema orientale]
MSTSTKLSATHIHKSPCNLRLQVLHRDPSSGLACWANRSDLESHQLMEEARENNCHVLSSLEEDNTDGHQGEVSALQCHC